MAGTAPTGTATVVLGDVAGSTRLWQEHPDVMPAVSTRLTELLDVLAEAHDGHLPREQGEGDNVVATFAAAADAVAFAVAVDEALATEPWPDDLTLAMRIGLHTGDVVWREGIGYLGPTFNRCARLRDLGRARMILLSQTTRDIVAGSLPDGAAVEDLGNHQLRDLSSSERVHLVRHQGTPAGFEPLKSVSVLPNNLPVPITSLVGREAEIDAVSRHVADHRLVTLTGAGGSGKTRLAQHVASQLLPFAPDGAWWVDLTPVADDDRVPVALAESAGVADVSPSPRAAAVVAAGLGHREALLVLDNCEHVVDAVADLVELVLRRCPNVRVLATSRETLDVEGERAVRVRPLGVPDEDGEVTGADLLEHPATRLFLDRATTLDPPALDADQRRAVAKVCRRLDGMPLAIELAASRTRVLSLQDIEAGLDDRFRLLRAGGRRGRRSGGRDRTLEASIAWSFDLLDEDEEAMLCHLAVFPGPFDLDGATAVGASNAPDDALDLLSALVDKSLVSVRPADDGRRYRLLESIRHFALDRLLERGDDEDARRAHVAHTVASVDALVAPVSPVRSIGPVVRIPPALLDDIRTADATAMATGDRGAVVDLYWPLIPTLMFDGAYHDAVPSLLELVADDQRLDPPRRARAYVLVLHFLNNMNHQHRAIALTDRALVAAREAGDAGDEHVMAGVLAALAQASAYGGHPGGSDHARACLTIARRIDDRHGSTEVVATLALFCVFALAFDGDERGARAVVEEALAAADAAGFAHVGASAATNLVVTGARLGLSADQLFAGLDDARARIPESTPRLHAVLAVPAAVQTCLYAGRHDDLARWLDRGLSHAGPPGSGTHGLMRLGRCIEALAMGDVELLLERVEVAARIVDRTENRWFQTFLRVIAATGAVRGDHPAGPELLADARDRLPDGRWPYLHNEVDAAEARLLVVAGDPAGGLELLARAADRQRRTGTFVLLTILPLVAVALLADGRPRDAATALGALHGLLARTGWADVEVDLTAAATTGVAAALGDAAAAAVASSARELPEDELLDWLAGFGSQHPEPVVDRPVSGWEALTPAELDVARHVARGLTNREVGEVLFVSENTVKTHLKSVYAKLDIRSRAELAADVAVRDD